MKVELGNTDDLDMASSGNLSLSERMSKHCFEVWAACLKDKAVPLHESVLDQKQHIVKVVQVLTLVDSHECLTLPPLDAVLRRLHLHLRFHFAEI